MTHAANTNCLAGMQCPQCDFDGIIDDFKQGDLS
jgi:hypothetical protein